MTDAAQFIGTWRLQSFVVKYPDGNTEFGRGENPDGLLMYAADGMMSVQLYRTDDKAGLFVDLSSTETAFKGFATYFGRYSVDEMAGLVQHHVLRSSYRGFVGRTLTRSYEFSADTLILRADSPLDESIRELVWQRVTVTASE